EFQNLDLATKYDCCAQILEGGVRLAELGILHFDQKPENIFYREIEEKGKKRYIMDTADLGSAEQETGKRQPIPVHTTIYMPQNDLATGPTQKTCVYQRGAILFNFLTGGLDPWPIPPGKRYPDHSDPSQFNEKALIDRNVPQPIRQLIREMCDPVAGN